MDDKKIYWVSRDGTDSWNCPICGSSTKSCHVGDYCTNNVCSYANGGARLTVDEV